VGAKGNKIPTPKSKPSNKTYKEPLYGSHGIDESGVSAKTLEDKHV